MKHLQVNTKYKTQTYNPNQWTSIEIKYIALYKSLKWPSPLDIVLAQALYKNHPSLQ